MKYIALTQGTADWLLGKPAVIEKGSRQSAMPELMSLIKKMAYFG